MPLNLASGEALHEGCDLREGVLCPAQACVGDQKIQKPFPCFNSISGGHFLGRTPLFRAAGRSGPDVSRAERFFVEIWTFGYSSAYIFVYSTWRNTQGSEMPAKTLSIR